MEDHIKCSVCKCKYVNDKQQIKIDFGYNKQNERYKSCVKCRNRNAQFRENHKEQKKDYDKQRIQTKLEEQPENKRELDKYQKLKYDEIYNHTRRKELNITKKQNKQAEQENTFTTEI